MMTQLVRRAKWICVGVAPFIASHHCDDARDELVRAANIYGRAPDRVWRGRRGIIAAWKHARVFIVAPESGA